MARFAAIALILLGAAAPSTIEGVYVESRTCDVWTGPCFANGEINLAGRHAIVAWSIARGSWDQVALDGLTVVAALEAEGTLHTDQEGAVRAALYIDERADQAQRRALQSLARSLSPRHLAAIVKVEFRPISFRREGFDAEVSAGGDIRLRTTTLCECDAICCNEEMAYPPVSEGVKVECAKTVENEYRAGALEVRWSDPDKRSAMVGTFSR
jgi:hypothetical protein